MPITDSQERYIKRKRTQQECAVRIGCSLRVLHLTGLDLLAVDLDAIAAKVVANYDPQDRDRLAWVQGLTDILETAAKDRLQASSKLGPTADAPHCHGLA